MLHFTQNLMQSPIILLPAHKSTGSCPKFEEDKQWPKNVDLRYPLSKG